MESCLREGRITTPFDEPRPLSVPPEKRWHPHGALDLAGGDGIIRAPAAGTAQGFAIFRGVDPERGLRGWGDRGSEKDEVYEFPWREYYQDIYGAFVVLIEPSGRLHIMTHIWPAQILNPAISPSRYPFRFRYYIEEAANTRWPTHLMMTDTAIVNAGQPLARVGNAGFSTGSHVHWEIHHHQDRLDDYKDRIDPMEYI